MNDSANHNCFDYSVNKYVRNLPRLNIKCFNNTITTFKVRVTIIAHYEQILTRD